MLAMWKYEEKCLWCGNLKKYVYAFKNEEKCFVVWKYEENVF